MKKAIGSELLMVIIVLLSFFYILKDVLINGL